MSDDDDPAWSAVKTWPGLRAQAKEAWRYLWRQARRRPDTMWVRYCELANDQGTGERSGRRCIDRLVEHHLIEVLERLPGRVRVYLWDPREVCRGRVRTADEERPLLTPRTGCEDPRAPRPPLLTSTDSPVMGPRCSEPASEFSGESISADVAQHPPADPPVSPPLTFGAAARASPLIPLEPLVPSDTRQRLPSTSARAPRAPQPPPDDAGPQPLAAALGDGLDRLLAKIPGDSDRTTVVEALVKRIRQRVADPKLRISPALRVAQAVVYGRLPEGELDSILICLEQARKTRQLRGDPLAYFVGAAKQAFRRHGLEWPVASASHGEAKRTTFET